MIIYLKVNGADRYEIYIGMILEVTAMVLALPMVAYIMRANNLS